MDKQKGPRHGDFTRECRSVAARLCDGFKPTSQRPQHGGGRGAAAGRRGRAANVNERPTHGGTEPGVRQSSGALAAWYRWQHGSDDRAADSSTATDYCAYRLALEQQQHARTRGRVAAILREL